MSYVQSAFDAVIKNPVECSQWFVALMESVPYYGGPEEGGWWGEDNHPIKFAVFHTQDEAEEAAERVRELAKDLERDARDEYGDYCLRQTDWLDARGLDADFLAEPDGPSKFWVYCGEEMPQATQGSRQYC